MRLVAGGIAEVLLFAAAVGSLAAGVLGIHIPNTVAAESEHLRNSIYPGRDFVKTARVTIVSRKHDPDYVLTVSRGDFS